MTNDEQLEQMIKERNEFEARVKVLEGDKWISCKDKWPEGAQGNLVLGFGNGYFFEAEYDDGYWTNIGGEEMTHWQELPSPPTK